MREERDGVVYFPAVLLVLHETTQQSDLIGGESGLDSLHDIGISGSGWERFGNDFTEV